MTAEQIKSLARWFGATAAGGVLLAKLGISLDQIPDLVDGVIALGTAAIAVWGIFVHAPKNIVAKAADIVPVSAASQLKVGIAPAAIVTTPTKPPAAAPSNVGA